MDVASPLPGIDILAGVILIAYRQPDGDTPDITRRVEAELERLRPGLEREGIEYHPGLFRQANFIEHAVGNVTQSLLIGAVLVTVVLFLFLFNLRTALISLTAIPLSLLTAVIVLWSWGVGLNTLTLGGLAIAVGEVVDDAIIDVENIFRRLRENQTLAQPRRAFRVVLEASLEVRSAVVYATFIVALVFLPVLTLTGLQGSFFAPLALSYILAIMASLAVALTATIGLVAYVVAKGGTPPASGELQRHLKQHLPEYMVPATFVRLDKLPLTPNGKLDHNALPAPSANPATGREMTPRTVVEEMLSAIWCDVLQGAPPGIDDNFFDCGGHSLIAAQLIARIADAFSIELPLRTLFEAPTIRTLAPRIEEARQRRQGLVVPPLTRRPRNSPLPLSYAQEPLWFLDQVGLVGAAYNVAGALRMDGRLDVAALAQSFDDVVRRHENLRTRFALVDGQGTQVIDEPVQGTFEAGRRSTA